VIWSLSLVDREIDPEHRYRFHPTGPHQGAEAFLQSLSVQKFSGARLSTTVRIFCYCARSIEIACENLTALRIR